jgi:hypothetical protein
MAEFFGRRGTSSTTSSCHERGKCSMARANTVEQHAEQRHSVIDLNDLNAEE